MHLNKENFITLAVAAGLFTASAYADDNATDDSNPNWFSAGPVFGLNMSARFKHMGDTGPTSGPSQAGPATGGGIDRTYDDGFVHVDSSGNAGGLTWNWGYQNSSQVQGSSVVMHSESVNGSLSGTFNQDAGAQMGFDLTYGRRLGTVLGGKWGFELAFDFTTISIQNNSPLEATSTLISDTFSLGDVIAPDAPYTGSFNGPGPLLGDSPSRSITTDTVLITAHRSLCAQIYAFRTGLYYESPEWHRFSIQLSGGLGLAIDDSHYSVRETLTDGSAPPVTTSGSSSGADVLVGGYGEGKLLYALTHRLSLYAGAQYEYLGTVSRAAAGETAQLNLSHTVNVSFGLEFKF